MKSYWVYILASRKKGTLYTGITSNIGKRVYEHKEKLADGFTKKHGVDKLVYAEECNDADAAHALEKCIKRWKREWKIRLIEELNPEWNDLYDVIN